MILVSLIFFSISFIPVFAQTDAAAQDAELALQNEPVNAIQEAERALPLGEGATGATPMGGLRPIWSILRMLLVLAFAAAAIYGVVYFIKRAGRQAETADPFLKVLASTPLGAGRSAHVISLGTQAWVVGAAENGVHLISVVDDKDVLNAMLLEDSKRDANEKPGALSGFGDMLRRWGMQVQAGSPGPESIRKRRERLKGLQQ